jgi:hypothetical protein
MKKYGKSFLNSLIWILFTSFFGLIQVWFTIIVSYVRIDKIYSFSIALEDGSLLFFIMALVAAVTIDYFFSEEKGDYKKLETFVFFITPMVISLLSTGLYVSLYTSDKDKLDIENFSKIQIGVIILAIIYAFSAKFLMFFKEDKENNE